jgi:hypothetical protein
MQNKQLEKQYNSFNLQQKKRFPTFQSYLDEVARREGNRIKANKIGNEAARRGEELARQHNAEYDEFIRENPDQEVRRINGKLYNKAEFNAEQDQRYMEKFAREHPTRHAWNEKFFRPVVQGLTNVADKFNGFLPAPMQVAYQTFAQPTSKYYQGSGLSSSARIAEEVGTPMTGSQVQELMPGAKMYTFKELRNINSVSELLGKHKVAIILYELEPKNGHWVMVFEHKSPGNGKPGDIECFDSLGFAPDSEIGFIPKSFRKESMQDHTHLLHLLAGVPNKIFYNEDPLQMDAPGVNTCGKWCVYRYAYDNLSIKQFQQFCMKNKVDDAVVAQVLQPLIKGTKVPF